MSKVKPKDENVGVCEACGVQFGYDIFHNGFGDSAYAYCNSCGCTVILSGWSEAVRRLPVPFRVHQPLESSLVPLLKACPCGGRFSNSASPRCPSCHRELSAEIATDYIERNAPGTTGGWRWQQSWSGVYCIVINGQSVEDWWDEVKLPPA